LGRDFGAAGKGIQSNGYTARSKIKIERPMMKKIILLIMSTLIFIMSCAQNQPMTEEERDKWRRSRMRYEAGQRGGP
jgi:hypothetical protein